MRSGLLSGLVQRGGDYLEAGRGVVRIEHQGRTDADRAYSRREQKQPALECRLHELRGLFRSLELERKHQAKAAHVGHVLRSEEHTSELQSHSDLVCRLL